MEKSFIQLKRVLGLLMVIGAVVIVLLTNGTAFAADEQVYISDNFTYTVSNDCATIVGLKDYKSETASKCVIPSSVDGYVVTVLLNGHLPAIQSSRAF